MIKNLRKNFGNFKINQFKELIMYIENIFTLYGQGLNAEKHDNNVFQQIYQNMLNFSAMIITRL